MTEYQAHYYNDQNELEDCTDNMSRREATEQARAWLSIHPVGCRAVIVQIKEVSEIVTARSYGVKHHK